MSITLFPWACIIVSLAGAGVSIITMCYKGNPLFLYLGWAVASAGIAGQLGFHESIREPSRARWQGFEKVLLIIGYVFTAFSVPILTASSKQYYNSTSMFAGGVILLVTGWICIRVGVSYIEFPPPPVSEPKGGE
ncbi:MAG: hypothetical protein GWP15_00265 [Nitrospirae bacterium]|nr:hypothetical protein [Nitrospirota bacterium]